MSGLIRHGMLPYSNIVNDIEHVRFGIHDVAHSAVTEPNPVTRSTLVALLNMDVGVYPVKNVMNLDKNVLPDEEHLDLLLDLAETANALGDLYSALGDEVLAGKNPDMIVIRLDNIESKQAEHKKIA